MLPKLLDRILQYARDNDIGLVQAYGRRGWVKGGRGRLEGEDDFLPLSTDTLMGGSTTTNENSSSQSVNEIPQWVHTGGAGHHGGLAQDVASQPLQQYQGQMVADVSPQMQQAWNQAANSGNVGQSAQNAGQSALMTGANYTPQQVSAPTSSQLAGYLNPYTQDVINATLPIMQQNLGLSQDQQQNAASSANAYGGSRQAIQQGVTQAQGAMGMGQMAAQLNQANFGQAETAAQQANLANQQAGLTANQQQIAAGQALGTLGGQQMQNNLANYGMLVSAGGLQEQQQQNDINAQIAKFQQAWQYPQQQLGMMESSLGMTPYNTGTSGSSASTTEQTQSNPVGAATSAMQMLGGLFTGNPMAVAGGAGGMLGGTSDRRLKTDIKRVDTHPTGLPIYSYRYKGDPKTYPKVMGPMAEDVAKIAPHAVRPMGVKGRLAVHMPTLDALGASATPPSSPGVARAIGMLAPSGMPGRLSPMATPPSRGALGMLGGRGRQPRVMGALGG